MTFGTMTATVLALLTGVSLNKKQEVIVNPLKQYKKLQRCNVKAELCESREEAQKLIQKADKAQSKLNFNRWYESTRT